jgi:hypothetical protein
MFSQTVDHLAAPGLYVPADARNMRDMVTAALGATFNAKPERELADLVAAGKVKPADLGAAILNAAGQRNALDLAAQIGHGTARQLAARGTATLRANAAKLVAG